MRYDNEMAGTMSFATVTDLYYVTWFLFLANFLLRQLYERLTDGKSDRKSVKIQSY
jgi:hypothetical protein